MNKEKRLINIWSTILLICDKRICDTDEVNTISLDILISNRLLKRSNNGQIWMVNTLWEDKTTLGKLITLSYNEFKNSTESYITLVIPGYADAFSKISSSQYGLLIEQLCLRARAFNKKVVFSMIGYPSNCPDHNKRRVDMLNEIIKLRISDFSECKIADLRHIKYKDWDQFGSKPLVLKSASDIIVNAICECHPFI